MGQRQRFTKEFKLEAVRLLKQSGRPAAELARELGVPRNRLYKWAAQLDAAGGHAFPGSGHPVAAEDEVIRLRRENEIGRASCREKSVDLGGRRIIKKKKKKCREQEHSNERSRTIARYAGWV